MPAGRAVIPEGGGAAGRGARDGLSAGSRLPGRDIFDFVTIQLHVLRFDASWIMANATLGVGDVGGAQKPVGDGVAPDFGLASLVFELCQDFAVTLVVYVALECFP